MRWWLRIGVKGHEDLPAAVETILPVGWFPPCPRPEGRIPLSTDDLSQLLATLSRLDTEEITDREDLGERSTAELVAAMNTENATVPAAIGAAAGEIVKVVDAIAERMARGGRLFYLGAGTAGRMGVLDASEVPPTFGTDPGVVVALIAGGERAIHTAVEDAEDDADAAGGQLSKLGIGPDDSIVGISASGRSPYVVGGLRAAGAARALTVALSSNANSEVGAVADYSVEVVTGPEFITGSTRLKAGTAQKLVLNMISTLVMVRLGKTYRGVMVDLKATNAKLRARSVRTVMAMTGADSDAATAALAASAGSVKSAILCVVAGVDDARAQELLAAAGGHLAAALSTA